MTIAYFVTATVLILWIYKQARCTARTIRVKRQDVSDTLH